MHEYGISGMFMAHGLKEEKIKEKKFQYSCKVGEFKHFFDSSPEEASVYAKKKLMGHYSPNSIEIFTNSFRKIHDLTRYCHSDKVIQDVLISKLQILQADFENVPEITRKRIIPLMRDEMDKLISLQNLSVLNPGILNLCDKLVEYLHSEVMGAEAKSFPQYSTTADHIQRKELVINYIQKECPVCGNVITESNKSLICMKCRSKFCLTCEEWFRVERKRGEKPLCEKCFDEERQKEESRKKAEAERLKQEQEEKIRKQKEEADRKDREKQKAKQEEERKEKERKAKELQERLKREQEEKEKQRIEEEERKKSQENPQTYTSSIGMGFTLIPAGEFMMGSEEYDSEKPVHRVKISKPFYLGIYPVTQREWNEVIGSNPSHFKGDNLPVESVSWNDVQDFIKKLNKKEGANKYRLPTEAEWEYAARAGTTTRYSFGDDKSKLGDYAWYCENSGSRPPEKGDYAGYDKDDWLENKWSGKTHDVRQKQPNPWGLYDMHGNVWEWVQDNWHGNYNGAPTDGSSWESGDGSSRVLRGGGWNARARGCRSASRCRYDPDFRYCYLGFRLLRIL